MSTGRSRRRRTAEEARYEILAAAQRRLAEGGPEAIRLQEIARDVGISHTNILHHFESREGLMQALGRSAMGALSADILRAIADPERGTSPEAVLDRIFATLGESGHARLLAWAALSDRAPAMRAGEPELLRLLGDAVHRRLGDEARERGGRVPPREETDFVVRLVATAMLGDALMGPVLDRLAGARDDAGRQRRFRVWLARLVSEHLERSTVAARRADGATGAPRRARRRRAR